MSTVGLLILAAGGSRRLGVPKQLLRDGTGRSLIRRAAETGLASLCRPIVVVVGAAADAVTPEIVDLPLMITHNPSWETGMASSLRTGLQALTEGAAPDAALIMLCDQPNVTPALLETIVAARETTCYHVIACEYDGILGVPALFDHSLFSMLNGLAGDEGARRVLKNYSGPIARVPFPEGVLDIDTAAHAQAFETQGSI